MFTGMSGSRASDRPNAPGVLATLGGTRFADVRWVASTGSTNADALELARDGAPEGIVVVADHQTAGRGRRSRTWTAPPGASLLVSVLLRPPAGVAGAVTMAVAVSMAEAVADLARVEAGLKWPNDLVVGDRKLAGILAEADWPAGATMSAGWRAPAAHERVSMVVGIGLNVSWPAPAEAGDLAGTATALNWLGADVDRADLLVAFLQRLDARYGELVRSGSAEPVMGEWRRRSATLGRRVRVDIGPDDIEGTAVDVTDEGHLVVETPDGDRRTFAVGDVVHLRPA
jgi:BirA family transcriptional regulator, biotin operon repressor / biotin---[acetyl-CoA-carboxylase] ligase